MKNDENIENLKRRIEELENEFRVKVKQKKAYNELKEILNKVREIKEQIKANEN